jgi:hypothetical protein
MTQAGNLIQLAVNDAMTKGIVTPDINPIKNKGTNEVGNYIAQHL